MDQVLISVEAQRVVRRMHDDRLHIWGDLSRDVPFFTLPPSDLKPSARCCTELHKLGLIELDSDEGAGQERFKLSKSGLDLAKILAEQG